MTNAHMVHGHTVVSEQRQAAAPLYRRMTAAAALLALVIGTTPLAADTPAPARNRYLTHYPTIASLAFALPPTPPGPKQSDAGAIDLDQVKAAQMSADEAAKAEAFVDAEAFSYGALLPRFSVAAGRTLVPAGRPILAHMLKWVLKDTDAYSAIKAGPKRQRPFTEDPSILPCDQYYLSLATKPIEAFSYSYPSGHATNGYLAALLIAAAIPDHATAIMVRGVRYGTNRIVCGVHYPTDVAVGQLFARYLYGLIKTDDQFNADLFCAREEDALDRVGSLPMLGAQPDEPARQSAAAHVFSPQCASVEVADYDDVMLLKP